MKKTDCTSYDIIIIGCGLVGGSLALTLPPSLSIAVIDAESPMQQQPGYLALNIHSCRILKDFGIWDAIASHNADSINAITPIQQIDISEVHQPTEQLILQAEDIGAPSLGYVTSTTAIRETLLSKIKLQKNISLYCPEKAEDIEWPDEGMEKISVKLANQKNDITAKLVIMADGGRSPLRTQLGFETHEKSAGQHIVISTVKTCKPHHGLAFERFTGEGPIALLPINQDEYILVWTMNSDKAPAFLAQDEKALIKELETAYASKKLNIHQWHEIGTRKSYPIVCSIVKNPIKTRLVLMGNAAHTVHPVGAQGFNLSLKDALILSNLIQEATENQQDIGREELLKHYVTERQEDTNFVVYFTQFLLNVFSKDALPFPFPLSKLRSIGLSLMNQSSYMKQTVLKRTTGSAVKELKRKSLPVSANLEEMDSESYDILILGNRLIGGALACALDSKYRVAVLDRAPTPILPAKNADYELRINAYNRASEELLRTIGIWEKIPLERRFAFDKIFAASEQQTGDHLTFYSKTMGESHIGHFIENDLVTFYLHEQIRALPNIDFFDDTAVMEIIPSEKNIKIITQDKRVFCGKLLAACDGGNSVARNLLGIDVTRHPYFQRCIVGNIFFDGDLDKTAWQRFLKTGPLGLLPLSPGVCSLAWSCDNTKATHLLALDDKAFIEALNDATLGRLGKILRASSRQSFPLAAQHAESYTAQRTLLLGDAAHTIHPLGGLGANLGFQDVIAAVSLLNDPKNSSRDIGRRYLLDKYESMRRRHNATVMATMTAFNALFHQNHSILNSLGRLSLNLANRITPVKNKLFREAMWMGNSAKDIREKLKVL